MGSPPEEGSCNRLRGTIGMVCWPNRRCPTRDARDAQAFARVGRGFRRRRTGAVAQTRQSALDAPKPTSERLNGAEEGVNEGSGVCLSSTLVMIDVTHMAKLGWGNAVN